MGRGRLPEEGNREGAGGVLPGRSDGVLKVDDERVRSGLQCAPERRSVAPRDEQHAAPHPRHRPPGRSPRRSRAYEVRTIAQPCA